jgi:hypothetical protein
MLSAIINKFTCPDCAVQTELKIALPLYINCPACGIIYNIDKEKNYLKTFLPQRKLQPLKTIELSAKGKYKDKVFQIVGHIRSINTNSVSNEWLMKFDDGKEMWLIENGFNYFVFESEQTVIASGILKGKKVGSIIIINATEYTIIDLSKQIEFQMEGQIPDNCFNNTPYFKYETVASSKDNLISICIFDKDIIEAYKGEVVDYKSLQLPQ